MAGPFESAIEKFANGFDVTQTAVYHQALRGLDGEIEANTPEVTGNLKNSRTVSTLGPPVIDWKTKKFRNPDDAINGAIAGVDVGDTVDLGFRAPYAHKIEPKYGMLRLAGQRWRQIVDRAVGVVKGGGVR